MSGRKELTFGRSIAPRSAKELTGDPAPNLALEEAIFLENEGFLVRLWANSESVIIGRAQLAEFETDVGFCQSQGIPIVRRFTAGGTVYNGPGNLNWSVFVARGVDSGSVRYESGPRAIFQRASKPLLAALAECGVTAHLDPPNSLRTAEGKISGMAAYVSRRGFLCHGTLLVGADLGRVKSLTTPSPEAIDRKYTRSRDVKTANAVIDVDSFIPTFLRTLADETKLELNPSEPSEPERGLAKDLLESRYSSSAWNLGDPFALGEEPERR